MNVADVRPDAHVPRERWTRRQRVKNDVIYALVVASVTVAKIIPARALVSLGRMLGVLVHHLVPRLRRRAEANAARALGGAVDARRVVRRSYAELGALLGEALGMLDPATPLAPLPLAPGARECLEGAIAEGRGVVFASAHLGPWERVAATLAGAGYPITVVARAPYDPRLAGIYDRLRAKRGVRAVYRGDDGAGIALVRVLRKGGVLAIPMDLASRVASVEVPFLGAPARTAVGPARLALRTRAAVVVGTVAPGSGGLAISFVRVEACEGETDEIRLTARLNEELSTRIRALPHLWPWMHERFPIERSDVCS